MATASWSSVLAALDAPLIERRRRIAPAVERWKVNGQAVAAALPRALLGLWPLDGSEAIAVSVTLEGPTSGLLRPLTFDQFPLRIGRGEGCALQLPHAAVSTEHAEIRVERGQAFLMDLRSTNGTKRNGAALVPLTPAPLVAGDRVSMGPFALSIASVGPRPQEHGFELRAGPARERGREGLFRSGHSTDRFVRVRLGSETVFVRIPASWMRACWQRVGELAADAPELGPMEEGAAQFVLDRLARALSFELKVGIELSAWLTPAEAERESAGLELWLESDVFLKSGAIEVATSVSVPVVDPDVEAPTLALDDLRFAASVLLGIVRLKLSDWRQLEPGDALIPDVFWPAEYLAGGPIGSERGKAWLHVRPFWFEGQLLASEAGAKLRLDHPWLRSLGGDWPMADEDAGVKGEAPPLPVQDLELQVAIELDRFPASLGDVQRWRAGEVLSLRPSPSDPVRLVVETGMQRRVLAEGRVVLVNGKLGIEILKILTEFQDAPPRS